MVVQARSSGGNVLLIGLAAARVVQIISRWAGRPVDTVMRSKITKSLLTHENHFTTRRRGGSGRQLGRKRLGEWLEWHKALVSHLASSVQ